MNTNLELTKQFHEKFEIPINDFPMIISKDRANFRYKFMIEEIKEYIKDNENNNLENLAKELCDIQCVLNGLILEHGLQDIFDEMYEEVHNSNMSKEKSEFKMIKGENYKKANLSKFFKN